MKTNNTITTHIWFVLQTDHIIHTLYEALISPESNFIQTGLWSLGKGRKRKQWLAIRNMLVNQFINQSTFIQ